MKSTRGRFDPAGEIRLIVTIGPVTIALFAIMFYFAYAAR
jgi:hypothetical protein